MGNTKLSPNTLKRARALVDSTLETACSILSPSTSNDGYADVTTWGLRDATVCNVTALGEEFLTDEMRSRKAKHFTIQLPANCEIATGERITTTWKPDEAGASANLTIEIVDVNTPRQDKQLGVEAIGYQVA